MDALSKTAYVILGMLRLGRRTGYEIKALVDVSTRFFWAASYGQIYPELARLEELGLIEGKREPRDGRNRKAYELTSAGDRALRDWLTSAAPLHRELRDEGVLKLFFSDAVSSADAIAGLRRMRDEYAQVTDELRAIEPAAREARDSGGHRFPMLTLEWGIAYHEFLAELCERMERRIVSESATAEARSR